MKDVKSSPDLTQKYLVKDYQRHLAARKNLSVFGQYSRNNSNNSH